MRIRRLDFAKVPDVQDVREALAARVVHLPGGRVFITRPVSKWDRIVSFFKRLR